MGLTTCKAVEFLRFYPDEIRWAWANPRSHPAGIIFRPVDIIGVKRGEFDGPTWQITLAIRADERIPLDVNAVGLDDLSLFVEWRNFILELDDELQNR